MFNLVAQYVSVWAQRLFLIEQILDQLAQWPLSRVTNFTPDKCYLAVAKQLSWSWSSGLEGIKPAGLKLYELKEEKPSSWNTGLYWLGYDYELMGG